MSTQMHQLLYGLVALMAVVGLAAGSGAAVAPSEADASLGQSAAGAPTDTSVVTTSCPSGYIIVYQDLDGDGDLEGTCYVLE
jgi:hypothetical protein